MRKIAAVIIGHLAELILVGGCAVVAVGTGMIYLPAGLIVGGGLAAAGAIISLYGGGEEK